LFRTDAVEVFDVESGLAANDAALAVEGGLRRSRKPPMIWHSLRSAEWQGLAPCCRSYPPVANSRCWQQPTLSICGFGDRRCERLVEF
jgi:hypothetical protein